MIHGNSKDPVLVKKIYLKIWTLRSEVEQVVKALKNSDDQAAVELIKSEYAFKGPLKQEAGLTLIDGGADSETNAEDEATPEAAESEDQAAAGEQETENSTEDAQEETGPISAKVIQRSSDNLDSESVHHGVCVLSEVTMDSLNLFTSRKFMEGQSIVIEFQVPKRFIMNAEVVYCRPFNNRSRIISENKLQCRISARFTFLKEGERTLLRQFIHSIEPEVPDVVEVPKTQQSDDDDEFDDLAGLDF